MIQPTGSDAHLHRTRSLSERNDILEGHFPQGVGLRTILNKHSDDKEVVLALVQQDGLLLQFAMLFWNDKDVVEAAVKQNGIALRYATGLFKRDKAIVMMAVQNRGLALASALGKLRYDRDIVVAAVRQCGCALRFTSNELRNDKEIVLEALKQDGTSIRFASQASRCDEDLVREAVQQNGLAFQCVSDSMECGLLSDPYIVASTIRSARVTEHSNMPWLCRSLNHFRGCLLSRANLTERLQSVVQGLAHHRKLYKSKMNFEDGPFAILGTNARDFAELVWKPHLHEKLWLLQKLLPSGLERLVASYSGCIIDFKLVNELIRLAPIFGAFAAHGIQWDDLPLGKYDASTDSHKPCNTRILSYFV